MAYGTPVNASQFFGMQNSAMPQAPAQMPDIRSRMMQTPAPDFSQVSTDQLSSYGAIGDVLNQLISGKQQQGAQGGLAQSILAQRFQPTGEDTGRSILQTAQSFGDSNFKPATPQDMAMQRMGNDLAPYTTSLDLQGKAADVALKQSQANMYNAFGGASGMAGGATPGANLTGDAYLATLPPQTANYIKGVAEGRMPMPSGMMLKTPFGQGMLMAMSKYDPNFDAINYSARSKTRNDFTSGKSAQSINALNTVIGHMQSLSDAADSLNNGPFQPLNNAQNVALNVMGDPRVKNFDTTKKAVVDELTRVYRGAGGSEGDIKTWSEQINSANSPAQLHSVISTIGDLLESKVNALGEQYNQGMGTTGNPIQLVTPHAQQALTVLRQRAGGAVPEAAAPANGTDPRLIQELKRRRLQ